MPSSIPEQQDHYEVLGVPFEATRRDISVAYRKLALQFHPDKNLDGTPRRFNTAFQNIGRAHEVLTATPEREKYDQAYPKIKAQWTKYNKAKVKEEHKKKAKEPRVKPESAEQAEASEQPKSKSTSSKAKASSSKRPRTESPETQEEEAPRESKKQRPERAHVALKVGDQSFFVDEKVLAARSPIFRSWVADACKESSSPEIQMGRFESDVVAAYAEYCYSNKISAEHSAGVRSSTGPSKINACHVFFAKLYVLGEYTGDKSCCNDTIAAITAVCDKPDVASSICYYPCNTKIIHSIYRGTQAGSPARQLLVDIYVDIKASSDWLPKFGSEAYPQEFLFDLTQALLALRGQPTKKPPSYFDVRRKWFK